MKKVFQVFLFLIIASILYSFGISTYENIKVDNMIADFKSRGILNEEMSNDKRKYYEVTSDVELDSDTYIINNDKFYLGNIGDIVVTRESPFPEIPIIHQFISYYFGGHAAMVTGTNEVIEIAGFPDTGEKIYNYILHKVEYDEEGNSNHDFTGALVQTVSNYFLNTNHQSDYYGKYYRKKLITLRVKAEESERLQAVEHLKELQRKNVIYNYMFFLDTKEKYYCTDIMSRSYQSIKDENNKSKYTLNDDGFITSVNDLILSKDTMISNYFEVDKNGIEHIYYLVNKN